MKKILRTILLGLAIVLATTTQAFAASKTSQITISPFLREVRFSADEGTKNFEVEIANDSDKVQNLTLSVLDFGSLNETGGLAFAGSNASGLVKKYGLANWLQLNVTNLSIEAGKSTKIQATIIDDVSLAPGGHYAAIVAAVDSEAGNTSNQVTVDQKLSSLIFAIKTGGEKYDLKLDKIEVGSNRFRLPGFVTLHFYNPGNVHVVPRGTVKILAPGGEVISQGVINEESSFVLPETSKQLLVKLNRLGRKDLRTSAYKLQVDYRYDGIDKFARREQPIYITSIAGLIMLIVLFAGVLWAAFRLNIPRRIIKFIHKNLPRKQ